MNTISKGLMALALLSGPVVANAEMVVTLDSVTPDGANFDWNYVVTLGQARLDPAATNGPTCVGGTSCNPAGTFLTIYDFSGLVAVNAPPAGWTSSTQFIGTTAQQTLPIDSASIPNVTFTYSGPTIIGPVEVSGFSIVSSFDIASETTHNYTSQSTNNVGSSSGQSVQLISAVEAPTAPVPLPASVWLMLSGLGGLGFVLRRRKSQHSVPSVAMAW